MLFKKIMPPTWVPGNCLAAVTMICVTMLSHVALAQNDSDSLRWRLNQGDQFEVSLLKSGNIETQVDTRTRKVEIHSQLEFQWTVVNTESATATIEQMLTRIKLQSGAPGDVSDHRLSYDSANSVYRKGVSNTVAKQLKPLIGLTYQFVVSDRGEIKSVLLDPKQQQLLETIPASLPLKKLLTAQGQQANLNAAMWVLPETLSADRTWTTQRLLDSDLGSFNRTTRFSAAPKQDGIVQIDLTTDVQHDANKALKMFAGTGQIEFYADLGWIPNSQTTTRMITESPYRDLMVKTTVKMTTEFKMEKTN